MTFRTSSALTAMLLLTLSTAFVTIGLAKRFDNQFASKEGKCDHAISSPANDLRMLEARITDLKKETIFYAAESSHRIELGSLVFNQRTIIANQDGKKEPSYLRTRHDGRWLFHYCQTCKLVFLAYHE